ILAVISLCGYEGYFKPSDCIIWALVILLSLFIMFSISTFSAMCTGNSFALIVINAIFIFAPLFIASIAETILVEFLFGYTYDRGFLSFAEAINPAVFIGDCGERISRMEPINVTKLIVFLAVAVILYIAGYLLYKYRHSETSEEVAGFKVLNPVFKYFVTFSGTLAVFSLFLEFIAGKPVLFTFIVILASIIFYFGSEMILKKTVKVWHTYKGYLVFGAVFSALVLFVGLTSVCGYETYVPDIDDVESVAIYNYYYLDEEPFTVNTELNQYIIDVHHDLVKKENISILNHYDYQDTRIHISYKLKNGKTISRRYGVSIAERNRIMTKVHSYPEYRKVNYSVFNKNIKEIHDISIGGFGINETQAELKELFECIKHDFNLVSYEELVADGRYCYVYFVSDEPTTWVQAKDEFVMEYYADINFNITPYFKNTIHWLKEHGYMDVVVNIIDGDKGFEELILEDADSIRLSYYDDKTLVECEITDKEDIDAIRKILSGYYVTRESYRDYDDDVAIAFDGVWLCPSLDGYGTFRLSNTDMYMTVTNEAKTKFNTIVAKYGLVLP
ncbi:MAG: hypothetical protein IJ297_05100, partial [Clostridia bacterium]|nr:hypothetical protein [Clostridia bacterium]